MEGELHSQAVLWGVLLAAGTEEGNFPGILLTQSCGALSLRGHRRTGLIWGGRRWAATASLWIKGKGFVPNAVISG